jgi:hypothetical protein
MRFMLSNVLPGAACAAALLPLVASAQLSQPGSPASDWAGLRTAVPTAVLPTVDVAELLAEDAERGPFPLVYGEVIATDLGLGGDAGVWEPVPETGAVVWRLRIVSPGARSLGVVFTAYDIPIGGQVFLYDDAKSRVLGAFTDGNNNVNGLLGIEPVPGDAVTIEYVQESWVTGTPRLHVGEVIHDYKDIFNLLEVTGGGGGGAAEGGCGLIGINCPEGDPYQVVKRSVMRTLAGGALCSASLLNNTNNDGTPYMLTANHCGNMTSAQFLFEYEQASCGVTSGPGSSTLSGAVKLASSSQYDSQLYRLNTTPPVSFDPYFAGWSRATVTGSPATTVGHGGGGPKNIAIDNNGASAAGTDWQVFWHQGYIIGGNSGGPLFNGDKRVIGPACCVSSFVCGIQSAWYGRFDLFYNNQSLAQWLDPAGTNPLNLDGLDPFAAPPVLSSVTPSAVPAFGGGQLTLSGSGFLGAEKVKIGTFEAVAPFGFTIVDDTTIKVGAPKPAALTTVPVSIEKASGTSGAVNVTFEATDPPKLAATGVTLTGLNVGFDFGAQPNDLWFLFVSLNDSTTIPYLGFNILANPIFLANGSLDSVGLGHFGVLVPPGLAGGTIFSQIGLLDDQTFAFLGATNLGTTQVVL